MVSAPRVRQVAKHFGSQDNDEAREYLSHQCRRLISHLAQLEAEFSAIEPEARARNDVRLLDALIQINDGVTALRAACSGALLVLDDDKDTLPS
jgi:hypothetical protein